MNYKCLSRPGTESKFDLIVLCRHCHNLIEDAKKHKIIPVNHNRETVQALTYSFVQDQKKQGCFKTFLWVFRKNEIKRITIEKRKQRPANNKYGLWYNPKNK